MQQGTNPHALRTLERKIASSFGGLKGGKYVGGEGTLKIKFSKKWGLDVSSIYRG